MDADFFLGRLYPLQDAVLARIASTETGFYLTGGTAASRGYLHHRFSDDLDLFVNDEDRFALWSQRVTEAVASAGDWHVEVVQRGARFVCLSVLAGDSRMNLSCQAALDAAHSKAAGLFPADVARALLTVTEDDWKLVRWSDGPDVDRFMADLARIGERLLLVR
jgi:hypothetical protein